jgi:ribosomal protein S18 acetylase RimI-like enzyme
MVRVARAVSEIDISNIRTLFTEYASSLGFDLSFQDFEKELAELPGEYSQPNGCLLLALEGDRVAGCVGIRKLAQGVSEMKRLYVRPAFRGKGIGKLLAAFIIREAGKIGYKKMRLDTVPSMKEAIALYRSLGFKEIQAYRYNPIEGALFLELDLERLDE